MIEKTMRKTEDMILEQTKINLHDAEAWMKCLDKMVQMPYLHYSDIAMIMQQKPDAVEVHTEKAWKLLNYYPRKASVCIDLLNHTINQEAKVIHVWDISDVEPDDNPVKIVRWEMQDDMHDEIAEFLKEHYYFKNKNLSLPEMLKELGHQSGNGMALDTDKDRMLLPHSIGTRKEHKLIEASAEYILLKRCGFNPDYAEQFSDISELNNEDAVCLASAIVDAAKDAVEYYIRQIGEKVIEIQKREGKETDFYSSIIPDKPLMKQSEIRDKELKLFLRTNPWRQDEDLGRFVYAKVLFAYNIYLADKGILKDTDKIDLQKIYLRDTYNEIKKQPIRLDRSSDAVEIRKDGLSIFNLTDDKEETFYSWDAVNNTIKEMLKNNEYFNKEEAGQLEELKKYMKDRKLDSFYVKGYFDANFLIDAEDYL